LASTILVFGKSGQVARELERLGAPGGLELRFAGRETLDLANDGDAGALIEAERPAAVINAAAYTAVDKAESDQAAAFRLNRDAPAAMARACARQAIPFVHFSTDYVFDGAKSEPYLEADPTGPTGVYGLSKLEGEREVQAVGGRAAILRTAWVYSAFGANFVKTMLRLAAGRDELGVVADQQGRPTWAADAAAGALRAVEVLLDSPAGGPELYHLSGAGDASWADFAEAIFALSAGRGGPSAAVRRIATADYPTPARRPANSRLDCARIEAALGLRMRPWREGLAACLDHLETMNA
jgi:dTDP-4-dehydrorhamnose reductase